MAFATSKKAYLWAFAGLALAAALFFGARPVFAGSSSAQDQGPAADNPASSDCFSTHAAGVGVDRLVVCFSVHGNLMQWQSAGQEFIRLGIFREGYVVCDGGTGANYADYGAEENLGLGAFGASAISQPNGANTLPLTITRTTTDGRITLIQTHGVDHNEKDVTFTEKIRNNTGATLTNVRMMRVYDSDAGGTYSRTLDSVWNDTGNGGGGGRALALSPTKPSWLQAPAAAATPFGSPDLCGVGSVATPAGGDLEGHLTLNVGNINPGTTKTAKFRYHRL